MIPVCPAKLCLDPALGRRAARISDPVKKLRLLRSAARSASAPRRRIPWRIPAALAAAITLVVSLSANRAGARPHQTGPVRKPVSPAARRPQPAVWPVAHSESADVYSNGLRIENAEQVENLPRRYRAASRGVAPSPWRTEPAGIVFHTSESDLAPLGPQWNQALLRNSADLVRYVRQHRCYHFLIDRFGRVFRIVAETAKADHAGHSVWADDDWVYVNLNDSFLGLCFEGRSGEATRPAASDVINAAQVRAGRVLVEMLREKYRIRAENCVTHAQVSVNPGNFRIGYHTDLATGFPFAALGLPDNYEVPPASVALFGFDYDEGFLQAAGWRLWPGLRSARERIEEEAAAARTSPARYRYELRRKFESLQ